MKPSLLKIALFVGCVFFLTKESKSQITKLQDYENGTSATIGTYQGITFKEGGFSGLYPIPGTNGTEFWTCSDRGPNIDCANANLPACRPTYDKMYPFPTYAPKIHRIRISGNQVTILQTIPIRNHKLGYATGVINPTGFGSSATEIASTDTVLDCSRFNLKTFPKDTFGIDPEGIIVDAAGNFWLCEEGGTTIWMVSPTGILLKRYTPYANLFGAQSVDVQIDTVFKYRKNNRGFEGIAIAPNGKIYAIIQSAIQYPNASTGDNSRIHRILEIDPVSGAQKMYAYLNDGIIGTGSNQIRLRDWKIGDLAAVNDTTFLVLEAAARGTTDIKRMYLINIKSATAVTSGLYGSTTLEGLVDSTGLANYSIKPVTKTLVMDLLANGWPASYDKAEGLAIINDSTIAIGNDNDYGQTSPNQDGLATATGLNCHVITYRLSGSMKLKNLRQMLPLADPGTTGSNSSQAPFILPMAPGVKFSSIISAGDSLPNGYKMSGIPDGTGAYDNGDGTFTLLVSHEIPSSGGVDRAHGAKGAFVSKWVINKSNLSIVSGSDLIQKVNLWNGSSYTLYNPADTSSKKAFNRFCSADLPEVSAFYNKTTGLGTTERIYLKGEEAGSEGRAFGTIVTGPNAGTTYELPYLGKFSWENAIASPLASDKTVVVGTDDATPGQVYFYIGTKTNSGSEVTRAGLTNGKLFGVAVTGMTLESSASIPAPNTPFTLIDLGVVRDSSGVALNNRSNLLGVTNFLRPEDGAWDPSNPNDFYFVTTNNFTAPSRLWRLRFIDASKPELGGTITAVLDGTEGQKMFDNMTIDKFGNILLQEDPGGQAYYARIWNYNIATDVITPIAEHNPYLFTAGSPGFITIDEEASGIIDAQSILGPGMFLLVDQVHASMPGAIYENGQILAMYNPASANANPEIVVSGNYTNIVSGDSVAKAATGTTFGKLANGKSSVRSFLVTNEGPGNLMINGINLKGANSSEFSLLNNLIYPIVLAKGNSLTLSFEFEPSSEGLKKAMVEIVNNDYDERPFSFGIEGLSVNPEINVKGNNQNIANGKLIPSVADNTDFGTVTLSSVSSKSFVIENLGTDTLRIENVYAAGLNSYDFVVDNVSTFPININPGSNFNFTTRFSPSFAGMHMANLVIKSNDFDEKEYEFGIKGMGAGQSGVQKAETGKYILYPNPSSTIAYLKFEGSNDEQINVTITDLLGRLVYEMANHTLSTANPIVEINTAEFTPGVYMVNINRAGKYSSIKLVVQH